MQVSGLPIQNDPPSIRSSSERPVRSPCTAPTANLLLPGPIKFQRFVEHPHPCGSANFTSPLVGFCAVNQTERRDLVVDESADWLSVANAVAIELHSTLQFFRLADIKAERADAFLTGDGKAVGLRARHP